MILQVSHTTVGRWIKYPERKQYSKRSKVHKSDTIVQIIKLTIENNPLISLYQLKDIIKDSLHIEVSKELIRLAIKKQGITRKSARFYGCPRNLEETTKSFLVLRDKYLLENREIICIDETSFGRNGQIVKGYASRGKKLYIKKSKPRITTTSYLVAISKTSILLKHESKGSFNTIKFLTFIKNLCLPRKSVILLDNVKFHHSNLIKTYCFENGIELLFTPPYSPWFNPIESCFSIIKRSFYKNQDIDLAFNALNSNHIKAFYEKSIKCKGHC